ncbi:Aste57867_22927 [Aphanomyces stellatus]|uniref:Aste57867_22927 protein n=1 Tax=Aphanomyces stellatus TaxID=120398 RepID=A0A485LLH5_9STRA|nr:hypothetical protein As57867_022856 [Aphanomyces stellatus]VFT99577.1 Aste57867_22927 [Aphanomyces stellatus]
MMSLRTLTKRAVCRTGAFKQVHGTFSPSAIVHRMNTSPSVAPLFPRTRGISNYARRLESVNPDHVVFGLIGVNGLVWFMWQSADTYQRKKFMMENFMTSPMHLLSGRVHTLVTAAFSHMSPTHLGVNMLGLMFFGREVCAVLGPKRFLALYIGSAGASPSSSHPRRSSIFTLAVASFCQAASGIFSSRPSVSLGASGAINAITAFSICLFPHSTILIMFVLPLPAYVAGGLFLLRDLWGATSSNSSNSVGHVAHLTGAACGMAYYRFFFARRRGRFF